MDFTHSPDTQGITGDSHCKGFFFSGKSPLEPVQYETCEQSQPVCLFLKQEP